MTLIFDLDMVLVDIVPILKYAFWKNGIKYFPTKDWEFTDYPEKVRKDVFMTFGNAKIMTDIEKYSYVDKTLKLFKAFGVHIVILTGRKENQEVRDWIESKFPYVDDIILAGRDTPKIEFIKYFEHTDDSVFMIDDDPRVIEDCVADKTKCYLIRNDYTLYNHYIQESEYCKIIPTIELIFKEGINE